MMTNDDALATKLAENNYCEFCDYNCCKKSDFIKHLSTRKHQNNDKMMTNNDILSPKVAETIIYKCDCGKQYKYRQGLFAHKKICNIINSEIIDEPNNITNKELIITLLKQNNELQNQIIELSKEKINSVVNSHNTTNSHNKAFNLNFFLNETCKEAMNIGEFVDSLKIQLSDLENIGETGYIEGISNIIVKNLKELDITKRPVHCTDKKRETIYIKDADKWEKDENKTQMHKLIKRVVSKNTKMFAKFKEAHPDCLTYHSKYSEQYNKIIYESMGGKGDDDFEKNEKIIKNVLKEVVVDKNY